MKKIFTTATIFLSIFSTSIFAEKFFNKTTEPTSNQSLKRNIVPQKYLNFDVDITSLKKYLRLAPIEFSEQAKQQKYIIELPNPDGILQQFDIVKSPIMHPDLANRFPQIITFCGKGITDKTATIRFDITELGFHAQVLSAKGTWYIDPYFKGYTEHCIVYFKSDYINELKNNFSEEGFNTNTDLLQNNKSLQAGLCIGSELRTYDVAIACTGEYAQAAVSANVTLAQALSAITTTLNRVDGVYETELAIRLVLIATETNVIYIDPTTDPFTGNSTPNTLINESQTVIAANIGTTNFDIGHTLSTGGGGLANYGCVCKTSSKAKGITGSPDPTGDAYDIDYVSHEMGHQFGGSHTFNSSLGSCSGNRSAGTAYEVGAGTSIMAYAGICSADNTQAHSDTFFHSGSFDEILSYAISGQGNGCATVINTGNTAPVVFMPVSNKYIPKQTPFMLTGSATDVDGDTLTYCWEEMDKGATTTWNGGAGTTTSPIFKSRVPLTIGTRIFPSLAIIKAGYPTNPVGSTGGLKGEILPTVSRSMNFRLTVRDNKTGGGGVATGGSGCSSTEQFVVNVDGSTGPFTAIYPNGSENFTGATFENITWDVAGSNAGLVNCPLVDVYMSTNGGNTLNDTIATGIANNGSHLLYIPNITTNSAVRFMIKCSDNYFFDISNSNFTINFNPSPSGVSKINTNYFENFVFPNPAKNTLEIKLPAGIKFSNFNYVIQNNLGEIVKQQQDNSNNVNTINIQTLSAGIYHIKLTVNNETFISKFVKEN